MEDKKNDTQGRRAIPFLKMIWSEWIAPPFFYARERVVGMLDAAIRPLIFIAIVILLFSAVMLFAATWHQITLLNTPPPSVNGATPVAEGYIVSISKWFLSLFVSQPDFTNNGAIVVQLGVIIGSLGAFATAFFSIATASSTWIEQRKLKSSATIQTTRIYNPGSDDIKIMLREYSRGHKVTIFGGDFSWLTDSPHQKNITKFLENGDVNFVSYRSLQEIKIKNEDIFDKISKKITIEESLGGLKASLIYDNSGNNLISYLYATKSDKDHNLVCKISAKNPDGRHLLAHILSFAKKYPKSQVTRVILVCGRSRTGKSAFCEKLRKLGYTTVSASQLVREFYIEDNGSDPNSDQLLDYGTQFIDPKLQHGNRLFNKILRLIEDSNHPLVLDGLRVPWIFSRIISTYGHKARYIHFSTNDDDRLDKLKKRYGNEFTPELEQKLNTLDEHAEFFRSLEPPEYEGEGGDRAYGVLVPLHFPPILTAQAQGKVGE